MNTFSSSMEGLIFRCDAPSWPSGVFGGKADSLWRLFREKQLHVPPFFAVSSSAPLGLVDEHIRWLLAAEGNKSLAVRSSGLEEDGLDCAMAGANLTRLNVAIGDVWQAVLDVRGSSKKEQAIPAIVQLMCDAPRLSGVAFSRHPLSAATEHVVINYGAGLGEAVVGGLIDPGQLVVSKDTLALDDPVGFDWAIELAKRVVEIEKLFGFAVDVEWCLQQDGKLCVLQARPITGILSSPSRLPQGTVFSNDYTKEVRRKKEIQGFQQTN